MLKTIFQLLLAAVVIWALTLPFIDADELVSDEQTSSNDIKKEKKKEKPLHNVKLPKFSEFTDVKEKKHAFFNFIKPHVEAENKKILQQRANLEIARMMIEHSEPLSKKQAGDIKKILKSYGLPETLDTITLSQALRRVDIIPKEMALMQAANESAWGTSRFARIGLNFFGQWCYKKGCGMVPRRRNSEAEHEVAAFKSVRAAVSSYFKNINTHNAYKELRTIREDLRAQQKPILATKLTYGLMSYSERGEAYIEELNTMINQNRAYFNE
ncbi:glucosaminidase [Pseudoalteromonas sp. S1610]|jgi:Bax protein|uniref:glucosaminidase domain-containing protein n=1 Tax=Pseudoalteromonas TaxID=53246 RepID=UPI0006BAC4A8|nr:MULTISPECIES: glucosaminidase domain-containing protein [Pseudoalteromonas]KPH92536.1 glucosaminidase [Pseudoalteromonas undina]OLF80001.1 glucosaminidase [Pseudoalteromonas haloplanktis]TMP56406.1 glucosaminidase [Pseudoalteromonas sp. S1610]|eukprot:gnl/Dysnectes_brevis/10_a13_10546.p1 GENE.gnl/Dysnectes_brevis/10_a13_10546~~gnl/Dysnectes_brevis/10_a13_10546.p1  ORF type:complete len:270 (+),score=-45.06 gnl/Dysnectes_brevis/10_a13_10546:556-1365(+)